MARGVAKDSPETREFLISCPAIEQGWRAIESGGYLDFRFDPSKVPDVVPDGGFFHLAEPAF